VGYWDEYRQQWAFFMEEVNRPTHVHPVPCYSQDLNVLHALFSSADPPLRFVRQRKIVTAIYGFVDASSSGFGSSFSTSQGVHFTYGVWGPDQAGHSSNYHELDNLVTSLEHHIPEGTFVGAEVFVFTDNFTVESAFYKGNTSSKTLFELILRLQTIEMHGLVQFQVIHVAGTRMISQGTDGLSRGNLTEGVMSGAPMLSFVPLHMTALARQPPLLSWICDWVNSPNLEPLQISDWFERGHGISGGTRDARGMWHPTPITESWLLWCPPPAIADVAIDELMFSRHKRSYLNHIFIVPRLCTHLWRKKLHKASDIVLELPPGARHFWPQHEHEPLLIGLTLRFAHCAPWQLRQSPPILALGRELQSVWKTEGRDERPILRQLSTLPGTLEAM
jgi:hypothetical protein